MQVLGKARKRAHRFHIPIRWHGHKNLRRPNVYTASVRSHHRQTPFQLTMLPFHRLRHGLPPLSFGNEPGVRKMEIYQAGSSQHKLSLCVTNVMVHGPGVKLLDGLAEAKHQWVRDLHLPLPSPLLYSQSGTILGPRPSPVPFCYWSGRRTVGILLENGGEWTRLATNPSLP